MPVLPWLPLVRPGRSDSEGKDFVFIGIVVALGVVGGMSSPEKPNTPATEQTFNGKAMHTS